MKRIFPFPKITIIMVINIFFSCQGNDKSAENDIYKNVDTVKSGPLPNFSDTTVKIVPLTK